MNKHWSELNKQMQEGIKREKTFREGIDALLYLRDLMFAEIVKLKERLGNSEFSAMPYICAKGYHNKTIAYSIWHIMRIEDIVINTIIRNEEQVFFKDNYKEKIKSPIITTGNELAGVEISEFSKCLNLDMLYVYAGEVKSVTDKFLKGLTYAQCKKKVSEARERIIGSRSVSEDKNAAWLIDYLCGKDIRGLIQMPLSRHWIMHIEAAQRIASGLKR